ncbi:hypothetical protein SAMD00023353_1500470 [Rosellinia necatrix]|uniref:Uncharacterized protein n=1 Tax=Rosellinia necatrix TaxID=77044 RepID=A0A1S8A7C1_ROSNE|nr:hypothetical protein SAMD00023353_1500470 [Rosellinia necatrix]
MCERIKKTTICRTCRNLMGPTQYTTTSCEEVRRRGKPVGQCAKGLLVVNEQETSECRSCCSRRSQLEGGHGWEDQYKNGHYTW